MKKIVMLWVTVSVLAGAVLLAGVSTASAQALDDVWFVLRVSAKGYCVGHDELIRKTNFRTTAYLHMLWNAIGDRYEYEVYSESLPGIWESTADGPIDLTISTEDYIFIPGHIWEIRAPGGKYISFYNTALIRAGFDRAGIVRKAVFTTLGAEVHRGMTPDCAEIFGGATVKGKLIAPEKLPGPLAP